MTLEDIIEDIQKAHIEAGGKFIKQREVRSMTVEELLTRLLPNNVHFNIKYIKPTQDDTERTDFIFGLL